MNTASLSDRLAQRGTNKNGVNFEIYEDLSIGDHYLIINDGMRPAFTGSRDACLSVAKGWVE